MAETRWIPDPVASLGELRTEIIYLGEMIAARQRLPAGFDPTPFYRGLPDGLCPCEHWSYLTRGRLRYRLKDGIRIEVGPGEPIHVPPAHIVEALDDAELIEFTRTSEYRLKASHLTHADLHRSRG